MAKKWNGLRTDEQNKKISEKEGAISETTNGTTLELKDDGKGGYKVNLYGPSSSSKGHGHLFENEDKNGNITNRGAKNTK